MPSLKQERLAAILEAPETEQPDSKTAMLVAAGYASTTARHMQKRALDAVGVEQARMRERAKLRDNARSTKNLHERARDVLHGRVAAPEQLQTMEAVAILKVSAEVMATLPEEDDSPHVHAGREIGGYLLKGWAAGLACALRWDRPTVERMLAALRPEHPGDSPAERSRSRSDPTRKFPDHEGSPVIEVTPEAAVTVDPAETVGSE